MTRSLRMVSQVILYAAFAIAVGWLSVMPAYDYASQDVSSIKLSLSHATERIVPCVRLTPEQIAKLAPNMRRVEQCERARLPLHVEIDIDGETVVAVQAQASGLWNDGPASVYERFDVAPGPHTITARLRDSARDDGWDYTHSEDVVLEPGRYFTVTFDAATGGFHYR